MYSKEESKSMRLEFWSRFDQYSALRRRQKGKPGKFIMNRTGIKQLKLKFEFNEHEAVTGIDIETRDMEKRLGLYEKLEQLKPVIEAKLGQEITWELDHHLANGKSISRISMRLSNVGIYEKESWKKVFPFFYKNMMKIEEFYEEYRDFLKY